MKWTIVWYFYHTDLPHVWWNFTFQMLSAICLEVLHRLSHLSMNVSGEFCVYEDPYEQLSRGMNCMTTGVGIKYVEHICTEVAPWSVLQKRNAFSASLLESSGFCLSCLSSPPWFICEQLFLCSQSLCCDLKLMPHVLDSMDAPSLLSRQYGVAAGRKKRVSPSSAALCIYISPSLPPSSILWHTTGEFSLNHMSFYSDCLFCVFLSLVVFCWAIVDVLHCWYESKYGFVCHTIVAMFPWLQDCSWFLLLGGAPGKQP